MFYEVRSTISSLTPKVFVLENVPGLLTCNGGADWEIVLESLRSLRIYEIHFRVLNSEDFGIPQHRPRLFIVGLRSNCVTRVFRWPAVQPRVSLNEFLGPVREHREWIRQQRPDTRRARLNVESVIEVLRERHGADNQDFWNIPYVVNARASPSRLAVMLDRCPCLTRHRPEGHWLLNRGRWLSILEVQRLFGVPADFRHEGMADKQFAALLGNSMVVPVVAAVLHEALAATGLRK